ncbi:ribokinase [Tolumonas lignilytica]|uniref:ribokinase n=1 Tax=Tolumonas lignilytica TaxID=1283284 RepID=UPI0004658AC6|nr:ribokinase [Tolumonas lignilytica]
MNKKLVVMGSVNADHILSVPRFPKPGETLKGQDYQIVFGGKGANQAVASGRLGADVSFIACVGDDDLGQRMWTQFTLDGIDTQAVMSVPGMNTGVAMIWVADSGENCIGISAGANAALTIERLEPYLPLIADAQMLLLQLETPLTGVEAAARHARAHGTLVVLNPAPASSLPASLLKLVDVITPNETEAEVLTGVAVKTEQDAQRAADVLHDYGIKVVLITLGAKGVFLSENGVGELIPGFSVRAVDTTAAGDTFNGALVTRWLEGRPIREAIRFAHAAAAISVTRKGAQPSVPTRQEVDAFLLEQSN